MPVPSPGLPPEFARSPFAMNRMVAYHKRRVSSSCDRHAFTRPINCTHKVMLSYRDVWPYH